MTQPKKLSIQGDQKYLGLTLKVLQELLESHDVPDKTTWPERCKARRTRNQFH